MPAECAARGAGRGGGKCAPRSGARPRGFRFDLQAHRLARDARAARLTGVSATDVQPLPPAICSHGPTRGKIRNASGCKDAKRGGLVHAQQSIMSLRGSQDDGAASGGGFDGWRTGRFGGLQYDRRFRAGHHGLCPGRPARAVTRASGGVIAARKLRVGWAGSC